MQGNYLNAMKEIWVGRQPIFGSTSLVGTTGVRAYYLPAAKLPAPEINQARTLIGPLIFHSLRLAVGIEIGKFVWKKSS